MAFRTERIDGTDATPDRLAGRQMMNGAATRTFDVAERSATPVQSAFVDLDGPAFPRPPCSRRRAVGLNAVPIARVHIEVP